MSLSTTLQSSGVTAIEAWEFIGDNLSNPDLIYAEAHSAGLTIGLLTELVSRFDNSLDAADVELYFSNAGLDPAKMGVSEGDNGVALPPSNNSTVTFNEQGDAVIKPEGPLTDEQLIFVAGIIEASFISDVSGTGQETLLTEQTAEGTLINVEFNDRDYQDIIVDLSEQDVAAMESVVTPILDQVYLNALQDLGYNSFDEFGMQGSEQEARALYDDVEAQIVSVIKPQYDALMAGQSDLWG